MHEQTEVPEMTEAEFRAEVLARLGVIGERLAAFEALLDQYRPALELVEKRIGRATRWKGPRNGG